MPPTNNGRRISWAAVERGEAITCTTREIGEKRAANSTLPPRSGGEGRPPKAGGVGGGAANSEQEIVPPPRPLRCAKQSTLPANGREGGACCAILPNKHYW